MDEIQFYLSLKQIKFYFDIEEERNQLAALLDLNTIENLKDTGTLPITTRYTITIPHEEILLIQTEVKNPFIFFWQLTRYPNIVVRSVFDPYGVFDEIVGYHQLLILSNITKLPGGLPSLKEWSKRPKFYTKFIEAIQDQPQVQSEPTSSPFLHLAIAKRLKS